MKFKKDKSGRVPVIVKPDPEEIKRERTLYHIIKDDNIL
tara:strand:- start:366 stop:482 length:117 start_codon:yes stop_codon:yes gene_type:complete